VTADGLVLCDDLIFFSRIAGTARGANLSVRQAKTAAELLALAREHAPRGVILDLQNPGLELESLLTGLRALPSMPRVVAYGSHVLAEALRAARQAGCDRVMPRSQFVESLEGEIAAWLSVE
jgi:CheY-like chemotaxis protein